jgi:hypothetical protein
VYGNNKSSFIIKSGKEREEKLLQQYQEWDSCEEKIIATYVIINR